MASWRLVTPLPPKIPRSLVITDQFWGEKEKELIDQTFIQERTIDLTSSFHQKAHHPHFPQFGEA